MKYINTDKVLAEIDRQGIGYNTDGKHTAEYDTCRKILDIIASLQRGQANGVNGVVHHYLRSHWIVTDSNQLATVLKEFPEGAEVELFICTRKEERK